MELGMLMLLLLGGGALASMFDLGDSDDGASDAEDPANPIGGQTLDNDAIRYFQGKGGDDTITGSTMSGAIYAEGLHGDDVITSEGQLLYVYAGRGDDLVDMSNSVSHAQTFGGHGEDTLIGNNSSNTLVAGGGNSHWQAVFAENAYVDDGNADVLDGMGSNDILYFGTGDQATGGTGTDQFNVTNLNTIYDADMSAVIKDWEVGEAINIFGDEASASFTLEEVDGDTLVRWNGRVIVTVEGASSADVDAALSYAQAPASGAYNTHIEGTTGDDTYLDLDNSTNGDFFEGYEGNDTVTLADTDTNFVHGGDGNDEINFLEGNDNVGFGGDGSDTLNGGTGEDVLHANGGHNTMDFIASIIDGPLPDDGDADVLDGGAGDDYLRFSGNDTATGGTGADSFWVDIDGVLTLGAVAVITDYEVSDGLNLWSKDTIGTISVVDEGGDAVVYVDGVAEVVAQGAAGVLTAGDVST